MKIFSKFDTFERRWAEIARRPLSDEEKALITEATVTSNQYGKLVCFALISGQTCEITLDPNSDVPVGTKINVDNLEVITLKCIKGEEDIINRISINF